MTSALWRGMGAGLAAALGVLPAFAAQDSAPPIRDNSFLIEEAYNQESRVVQHIGTWQRWHGDPGWVFAFTQEWPAIGQRHQLSYTVPLERPGAAGSAGLGDAALHYRCQLAGLAGGAVAFAPRATLLLPTGDETEGRGSGAAGVEANLPLSIELGDRWVAHTNAGAGWVGSAGASPAQRSWTLGQSLVWLARRDLNPMLELSWERSEAAAGDGEGEEWLVLAPGLRAARDFAGGLQIVPGVSFPIGLGPRRGEQAILLYLSVEHGY